MEAWRQQLAERPGEGSLKQGWRLARAAWRLARGTRGARTLVLLLGALAAATTIGSFLLVYDLGPGPREGDLWAIWIADIGLYTVLATFALAALVHAVDTAIDGEPLEAGDALLDAWDQRGPVLAWGLLSAGVLIALRVLAAGVVPVGVVSLVSVAWSLLTFFAIPALVLGSEEIGTAVVESARTFGRRWRQTLSGSVRISLWAALAWFVAGFAFGLAGSQFERELERGSGLGWLLVGIGLMAATFGVVQGAVQAFALVLYRHSLGDLPVVEPAPADPMRLRRRIAVTTASLFGLLLVVGIVGAATHHERPVRREADGYFCAIYSSDADRIVDDGAKITYRGRTVGYVVEHDLVDSRTRVVYWLEPWVRSRQDDLELAIIDPRPGHYTMRLHDTSARPGNRAR